MTSLKGFKGGVIEKGRYYPVACDLSRRGIELIFGETKSKRRNDSLPESGPMSLSLIVPKTASMTS